MKQTFYLYGDVVVYVGDDAMICEGIILDSGTRIDIAMVITIDIDIASVLCMGSDFDIDISKTRS